MFNFKVNGKDVSTSKDVTLLKYLREDLGLTSVKNGCSEGVCGTCTVLADGKTVRACIVKTSKAVGKSILTVEGIDEAEKSIYVDAFGRAGSVQCGFCIPGMVIAAKGLIDSNNNPSREDIKKQIRNNLCRCTGYQKIEDGILIAAEMIRNGEKPKAKKYTGKIGENIPRLDVEEKVRGTGIFADDMKVDGVVYGGALRTKYPRAKVVSINTEKAKAHPDALAIITAKDVPGNIKLGHIVRDWDVMIAEGETTRYLGDSLALVAATTPEALQEVLSLIEVEYEVYNTVNTAKEALEPNAPLVHKSGNMLKKEVLKRGDADAAISKSKFVVTRSFSTPQTEHAYMEPECAIAMPNGDDGLTIYTSSQSVFDEQRECSEMLGIPKEKIHVISTYVGGGFGGKEDMSVQHHAALLAYKIKKPVKVLLSRKESLIVSTKRHSAEMEFTVGVDEKGIIQGMKASIITDAGAYASLSGPVLQRACTHAAGPYNYQNIDIVGITAYTNNAPGGAFRGFGVTQSAFAMESILNELAEKVNISPWEIRYRNAIRPGQVLPNGQIADDSTGLVETLEAVKNVYESSKYAGIACAMKNAGLGVGVPDVGRANIAVIDGKVHVQVGASCIGQGLATVLLQMFCQTTGVSPENVIVEQPDTVRTPNSGTTTASRQTVFAGEAVHVAAGKFKEVYNGDLKALEGKNFYGEYAPITDPMGSDKPNPVSHVAYGYATHVVILNDDGKVDRVVAAHDVGRAVNPISVEGQVDGGVVMGLGYALTEDYIMDNGVPKLRLGTLGLFRADQSPKVDTIIIEKNKADLAYGAKGVGEIATIPTAPAAQGAYYKYDKIFRTKLPLENTPYSRKK